MWKCRTRFVLLTVSVPMMQAGAGYGAWNPLQDSALISWWTCDEGTGGVVADSSVHGNDGTFVYGSPAWTTGVYGKAVKLVGPALVQTPALGVTLTEATMAGWFLPDGMQPDWASILMHRNPGLAHGFNLLADQRLAYHWKDMDASWSIRGSAYYAADEWTFCALTVRPTKATFYVNGSAASINTIAHGPATWDGPLWLGGDGNDFWRSRRMNGALDDVSFFSRALTQAQIQALMLGLGALAPLAWGSLLTEDFETNDFSKFPWARSRDGARTITSEESRSGTYSARAGLINHDESSSLVLTQDLQDGAVTFWRKVSCEGDPDRLEFSIDGIKKGEWTGDLDWAEVSFPVKAGVRTFTGRGYRLDRRCASADIERPGMTEGESWAATSWTTASSGSPSLA